MAQAPAGWYPQPDGTQRYWDGAQWTEHISPAPTAAAAAAPVVAAAAAAPAAAAPAAEALPEPVAEPAPKAKGATKAKAKAETAPTPAEPIAEPAVAEPEVFAGSDMPAPVASSATPAVPVPATPMGGAPVAVEPAKKRKVWPIVLGVIGAIVLVFIIAIVAIVFFVNKAVTGPQEAVNLYDDAWQNVDCDAIAESTTEAFQVAQGYDDCATFEMFAQPFADSIDTYTVNVTNTEIVNGTAYVTTEEHYVDTDGVEYDYSYEYVLVEEDGKWRIDAVNSV